MTQVRPMTKIERIARACHEVNRAYCQAIGDNSHVAWEDSPDWQRNSAVNGVSSHILALDDLTPQQSHELWMQEKYLDGWSYGPVKDPVKKQHPCFLPYDQLPPEQRVKDYLFKAVVKILNAEIPDAVIVTPLPVPAIEAGV